MIYREPPPGMPEPPRRGDWQDKCPHGFLAKWQWCCAQCHPCDDAVMPVLAPALVFGLLILVALVPLLAS